MQAEKPSCIRIYIDTAAQPFTFTRVLQTMVFSSHDGEPEHGSDNSDTKDGSV